MEFIVKSKSKLTEEEKKILIKLYREYYIKLYGIDLFDSFIKVSNINETDELKYLEKIDDSYASNYRLAKDVIKPRGNFQFLLIYDDNTLVGAIKVSKKKNIIYISECAYLDEVKTKVRSAWFDIIKYIENLYVQKGCYNYELEIPYYDGPLLYRSIELGYEENLDDKIDSKFYVLKKVIEGMNVNE